MNELGNEERQKSLLWMTSSFATREVQVIKLMQPASRDGARCIKGTAAATDDVCGRAMSPECRINRRKPNHRLQCHLCLRRRLRSTTSSAKLLCHIHRGEKAECSSPF